MPLPKIKLTLFILIFIIITSIFCFFIIMKIYDQNSFLNPVEDYFEINIFNSINNFLNKNILKNKIKIDKKYLNNNMECNIVNINDKLTSEQLMNLLYFLENSNIAFLFIEVDFDNLLDLNNTNQIKDFFNQKTNFFGSIFLQNKKGINLIPNKYSNNKQLYTNFMYLKKINLPLLFSDYLGDINIKNQFLIPPNKIGFITKKNMLFDNNNIDLLFKFDNKILYSAPFLIYAYENNWFVNDIKFSLTKINHLYKYLYYDQKGRLSIKHKKIKTINPKIYDYKEWQEPILARINTIKSLKNLKLFESDLKGYELFKEEEKKINSIYQIPELKDKSTNTILTYSKNQAAIWKGFKQANYDKLKKTCFFISQNKNYDWAMDIIQQANILSNGINYKRIPVLIILLSCALIIINLSLLIFVIKRKILFFIIMFIILNIVNILSYLSFRYYLNTDFPFLSFSISILYGLLIGLIIRRIDLHIWFKEVKSIYKASISNDYAKKIVYLWKNNKWNLEQNKYLCSFVHIDTSNFLKLNMTKDTIDSIGVKNSEIESIIKNNYGVRNTFNSTQVLCYFGNPEIDKNHANRAINTCLEINNSQTILVSLKEKLSIAVHSKEEWFRFIKRGNQKYYTYFGNSIIILQAMLKYAKEYGISMIISDSCYKLSSQEYKVRMLDRVRISEVDGSIRLLELITHKDYEKDPKFYDYFHAGLKLFESKKWNEASAYFRQCLKINDQDKPSQLFFKRCRELLNSNSNNKYDGILDISN